MTYLVSIIIPIHNAEKYLVETIKSALKQTWKDIEIILVDDGSTDNSYKIAKKYESNIVKVLKQKNKGAAAARNYGLREANGDYIQFLDADDILSSNKIEEQVKAIKSNNNSVAVCSTIHFLDEENHLNKQPNPYEEVFIKYTSKPTKFFINLWGGYNGKGSMVQPNAWLVPKKLIDQCGYWNEQLSLDDDGEFFARVILSSSKITYTKNVFNYYRKFNKGKSLSSFKNESAYYSILKSTISKKKELLSIDNSFEAQVAIYRLFIDIAMQTYIKYPELYYNAIKELPEIRYPYHLYMDGSRVTKILSYFFGWKLTKRLHLLLK